MTGKEVETFAEGSGYSFCKIRLDNERMIDREIEVDDFEFLVYKYYDFEV